MKTNEKSTERNITRFYRFSYSARENIEWEGDAYRILVGKPEGETARKTKT
jgi:hypothetical protein